MMLLSRAWYVVLSMIVGLVLYVAYLGVGQYNRRDRVAVAETLASDSQVVGWALQIDARRRLDALLVGAVDKNVQDGLAGANGREKIPNGAKEQTRKGLHAAFDKIQPDFRGDSLFAVDRDGRVVGHMGFDQANAYEDFELGGYAAVNDALHGFLRDDVWVLGGKIYLVGARPVEYDVTQPPVGAIVSLKLVEDRFATEIARRTRSNVLFYSAGVRVASGANVDFDTTHFNLVAPELEKVETDERYKEGRNSDVHAISESANAVFTRLPGDAWSLGAGYAVVGSRAEVLGPWGFLSAADETDKAGVPLMRLMAIVLLGGILGVGFSHLEHTVPLRVLLTEAAAFKSGGSDALPLPKFRGELRRAAQDINDGIDRVVSHGGGASRRPADLEAILGPVSAKPGMSAFAVPGGDTASNGIAGGISGGISGALPSVPTGSGPSVPLPASSGSGLLPGLPSSSPQSTAGVHVTLATGVSPGIVPQNLPPTPGAGLVPSSMAPPNIQGNVQGIPGPGVPRGMTPPPGPVVSKPPPPVPGRGSSMSPPVNQAGTKRDSGRMNSAAPAAYSLPPISPPRHAGAPSQPLFGAPDDETTMVGQAPADIIAAATGEASADTEESEWRLIYEEFLRTKAQCGETTDGLTFQKFQGTLRKNRDALMERHSCKRVKFSVYVKEGRAALKASPVKG